MEPKILNRLSQRILQRELDGMMAQHESMQITLRELNAKDQKMWTNQQAYKEHKNICDSLFVEITDMQKSINQLQ